MEIRATNEDKPAMSRITLARIFLQSLTVKEWLKQISNQEEASEDED